MKCTVTSTSNFFINLQLLLGAAVFIQLSKKYISWTWWTTCFTCRRPVICLKLAVAFPPLLNCLRKKGCCCTGKLNFEKGQLRENETREGPLVNSCCVIIQAFHYAFWLVLMQWLSSKRGMISILCFFLPPEFCWVFLSLEDLVINYLSVNLQGGCLHWQVVRRVVSKARLMILTRGYELRCIPQWFD